MPTIITITVLPSAAIANAGLDESICNLNAYTLKANAAVVGNGKWTIVSGPTAINFTDDGQSNTTVSGLLTGNSYVLRWTISDAGCSSSSDNVQITVNPLSIGGTTSGDVNVCSETNSGNINLIGQYGNIVRWERSIDNGLNWSTITSTSNPYVFSNLTKTTQYKAIVQSGFCTEAISTVTKVVVNPGTIPANAGTDQSLCSGNGVTLNGNNPAPNAGLWSLVSGQSGVIITDSSLFNTTVSGLVAGKAYKFRWTIAGFGVCPSSYSETTITYYSPITNYVTVAPVPVRYGNNVTISGDTPTGRTSVFAYQWQESTDGNT